MYNVMFYHTTDAAPHIMTVCRTKREALQVLRNHAKLATVRVRKVSTDRYEHTFYPGCGFAYYIEKA